MKFKVVFAAGLLLAGCGEAGAPAVYHGDDPLPNGMTVKQQIESRQHNLKDLGGAFKAVNDQLKNGSPQLMEIRLAAAEVKSHSEEIANWFPAMTGPESGVKTDALPSIWEDPEGFGGAAAKFREEAGKLDAATAGEDLAAIGAQASATGAACKSCHDRFRKEKK